MNREELIARATVAIYRSGEPGDPDWDNDTTVEQAEHYARAALTVFEQAHAPTDDEWEALLRAIVPSRRRRIAAASRAVDRILAAGFRRTVQGEPTGAQVEAALNAYDPQAATDDDVADWGEEHVADMRAALRAALAAGREEGQ